MTSAVTGAVIVVAGFIIMVGTEVCFRHKVATGKISAWMRIKVGTYAIRRLNRYGHPSRFTLACCLFVTDRWWTRTCQHS